MYNIYTLYVNIWYIFESWGEGRGFLYLKIIIKFYMKFSYRVKVQGSHDARISKSLLKPRENIPYFIWEKKHTKEAKGIKTITNIDNTIYKLCDTLQKK